MPTPSDAVQQAIDLAGGQDAMAAHFDVTQAAVSQWKNLGLPVDRCEPIEAWLGVRVEDLRPDIQWQRDAEGRVTGYLPPPVQIKPTARSRRRR